MKPRTTTLLAFLALLAGCDDGKPMIYEDADVVGDVPTDSPTDDVSETMAIYALDPVSGPVTGSTSVTVSGRGFLDGATVSFGAALASGVTVVDSGQITLSTPPSATAGAVDVTVENPGGATSTLVGGFTYTDVVPDRPIGWCNLQFPAATATVAGMPTEPVFGRVYVAGCTDGDAQCADMVAEVGLGAPTDDPSTSPSSYTWTTAFYNGGHTDDDNDEYSAPLIPDEDGTYAYVFRFSTDMGAHYTYCDLDGNDTTAGGFSTDQMGTLTVADRTIGWCNLQHPATTTTSAGSDTESIYGRVYVAGCTDAEARCWGVTGEVGFGGTAADPSTFVWVGATYNPGHTTDDNDEYQGVVAPPAAGTYEYAYRFSGDGGDTWTYCDLDGSDDGYDTADAGVLTAE